jgi:hypothetical protein
MHDMDNFDDQPPRHRTANTSASAHPELLSGDLAVPPRSYVSVTSMNRSIASDGSRRTLGVLSIVGLVAMLSTILFKADATSDDGEDAEQKLARSCVQWHKAAGAVVSLMVQSTSDADLRHVSDSVFRLRRARRNCETGWVTLACQDYHAIVTSAPGYALSSQVFPCPRTD